LRYASPAQVPRWWSRRGACWAARASSSPPLHPTMTSRAATTLRRSEPH